MSEATDDDMRNDYDFSEGIQGKYHKFIGQPYTVEIHCEEGTVTERQGPVEPLFLDPDVREYFPDSAAVNKALRALIALVPEQKEGSSDSSH